MTSSLTPADALALKSEYLVPCVYHFYKNPPLIVAGEGCYLIDSSEKRYLDAYSGVTVMSAGHGNPEILHAIVEQLRRVQHTTTIYLTEPMFRLAERLAGIAPGALKRVFYCASGSEANEAAMLLATLATGRHGFIALTESLHGRTKWAMSATGLAMWRTDSCPVEGVLFAPRPFCVRCPLDRDYPECHLACVDALEQTIRAMGSEQVAAVIAEPIQGNGGIVVPPEGYWQTVRQVCDRYGILLIFDEVQTAMNRTGRWFACEHWGVVPDIMTVAKALGNGMPISAMIATDEVAKAYTKPGASTFGANPVSCAAALAVLDFHQREGLGDRAVLRGSQLLRGLEQLTELSPHLENARGKGLMIGVDVVTETGEPDSARCDLYLERLKDDGVLAGKTGPGRNVLTFMPPLIVEPAEISKIIDTVSRAALPQEGRSSMIHDAEC